MHATAIFDSGTSYRDQAVGNGRKGQEEDFPCLPGHSSCAASPDLQRPLRSLEEALRDPPRSAEHLCSKHQAIYPMSDVKAQKRRLPCEAANESLGAEVLWPSGATGYLASHQVRFGKVRMPAPTLLQRARDFASGPAAALAAIVPLAAAPTANATILNQASDVTVDLTLSAFDAETQYFGSPLNVVPGTNGTNNVSLTALGSLRVSRPPSGGGSPIQSHLAFVNTGTVTAAAGDIFSISYDFSLTPALSFGGDPATSDITWSLTAILDSAAGAPQSGSAFTAASGTTLDFTGSFDVASFTANVIADFTLLFDIFWTIPPILSGFSDTQGTLAVDVPADSIDLRLIAEEDPLQVPEPGTLPLMLAGLTGLLAAAWRRSWGAPSLGRRARRTSWRHACCF